jgi:hypothetical protein
MGERPPSELILNPMMRLEFGSAVKRNCDGARAAIANGVGVGVSVGVGLEPGVGEPVGVGVGLMELLLANLRGEMTQPGTAIARNNKTANNSQIAGLGRKSIHERMPQRERLLL